MKPVYNLRALIMITPPAENSQINYEQLILNAQEEGLIPSQKYMFHKERFYPVYKDVLDFWKGLVMPFIMPLSGLFLSIIKMCEAAWALLRVVGNLLILKPAFASTALKDSAFYFSFAVKLFVTAPINAVLFFAELFSRLAFSWMSNQQENTQDLTRKDLSLYDRAKADFEPFITLNAIPTINNVNKSRFVTPYTRYYQFFAQASMPVSRTADNAIQCVSEILKSIVDLLACISNLVIVKPQHALENLKSISVHFAVTIALLVSIPFNVLLDTVTTFSRIKTAGDDADADKLQANPSQTPCLG